MAKFQIEFKRNLSSVSFLYFEAEENIEETACQLAEKRLQRDIEASRCRAAGYCQPLKQLTVREWDKEKKRVKPKGKRFQLKLCTVKATLSNGETIKEQYYTWDHHISNER